MNTKLNIVLSKKVFLFILISISLTSISLAQKVKVKKILDSNLFELTDGRVIKLAGIDVPNINHKDTSLRKVGVDAFKYAKRMLLEKRFELTYPEINLLDTNFTLVYLIKNYPFFTRDFTKEYLQRGFGKFIPNVNRGEIKKYFVAEQEAKNDKVGIWKTYDNFDDKILDQIFLGSDPLTEDAIDSVAIAPLSASFLTNASQSERIIMEIFAGPLVGIPSIYIGGFTGVVLGQIAGYRDWGLIGYAFIGVSFGYIIGNAAGVYYISKKGNRDITFGYSILASFTGTALAVSLALIGDYYNVDSIYGYPLLALPTIATIVYANFIAPKKIEKQMVTDSNISSFNLRKTNLSHNDIFNQTKIFEINLFRINF